jgi:RNA polymerase sigma-70 factor (ECF subfamily)
MDYANLTAEELVRECTHVGSPEAWKEFVRRFQPLIAGVVVCTARRYGELCMALVDDLVQETYLRLCTEEWKRLREFQYYREGTVYGFMKAVARSVTLDYFKAQYTGKRGAGIRGGSDFDLVLKMAGQHRSMEDQILAREIDERLAHIADTARDRQIFLLYYRQGFTTKAIAEIPGIELSQKGVESCLQRLTRQLQRELAIPARRNPDGSDPNQGAA